MIQATKDLSDIVAVANGTFPTGQEFG